MAITLSPEQFAELMNRMNHAQQAAAVAAFNRPSRPLMRPRDPPQFDGVDKKIASSFLDNMEIQFQLRDITDDHTKILFAKSALIGGAVAWVKNVEKHFNGEWFNFVKAFQLMYRNVNEQRVATSQLLALTQTGSVAKYNEKFQSLRYLCNLDLFSDEMCKELYWNHLKPSVRLGVTEEKMLDPTFTLQQLMSAAQSADQEIFSMSTTASGKPSFHRIVPSASTFTSGYGGSSNRPVAQHPSIQVKAELGAVDVNAGDDEALNAVTTMPRPTKLTDQQRAELRARAQNGEVICFACRQKGHYSDKCTVKFTTPKK